MTQCCFESTPPPASRVLSAFKGIYVPARSKCSRGASVPAADTATPKKRLAAGGRPRVMKPEDPMAILPIQGQNAFCTPRARARPGQGQSTAKMHEAQNPRLEPPTPRFEEASQNASAGRSFLFDETKFCTYYIPRSFTRSYALQRSQSLSPMIGDPAALDYIGTVNSA